MNEQNLPGFESLETPERVDLHVDLAGVGSRSIAFFFDYLIVGVVSFVLFVITIGLATTLGVGMAVAIWMLLTFALFWFYFAGFEIAWDGQTPGKRLMGLRVQKVGGYPIAWTDAVIRNLLRNLIDLAAFVMPVGLLVMIFHRRHQRIGDLAAGTVVVREQRAEHTDFTAEGYGLGEGALSLTVKEFELVRGFLARREDFEPRSRASVAGQLAEALRIRLSGRGELAEDAGGLEPEPFLERLYADYRGQGASS